MIGNIFKIAALVSFFTGTVCAQLTDFPKPPDVIYVRSWRCLDSVLPKTAYSLRLGKDPEKFSEILIADNGRKFKLSVERDDSQWLSLPRWSVHLIDQTSPKKLRNDLIGEGGDWSSYLGYIYPRLKPIVVDGKNEPLWGDGERYPFVKTVRNIRIDDFVVTIAVTDIKWKDREGGRVSEVDLNLTIGPWRDRKDKDSFPVQNCLPDHYQR
ncbi:MAG: hypothetical protein IT172_10005 [Acidobacteria bacterium]|nr:hypothetical protein [Acidobacteriota bacterium]